MKSRISKIKNYIYSNDKFEKWYHTIIWWEIYRILYNGIMLIVGLISIAIASINIPLIYVLKALTLNLFYCLLWVTEISDKKELLKENKIKAFRTKAFGIYLILSIIGISIMPLLILLST